MRELAHFVDGKSVAGTSGRFADVYDPNIGCVQARVPLANTAELVAAVDNAETAQRVWAAFNPQRRARVLMRFLDLANQAMDRLARLLASEHGKTIPDARGHIHRGLEVVESATGIPHLLKGEHTQHGPDSIRFYTKTKTVTQRWTPGAKDLSFVIPAMA